MPGKRIVGAVSLLVGAIFFGMAAGLHQQHPPSSSGITATTALMGLWLAFSGFNKAALTCGESWQPLAFASLLVWVALFFCTQYSGPSHSEIVLTPFMKVIGPLFIFGWPLVDLASIIFENKGSRHEH